jgi:hypothetical protein
VEKQLPGHSEVHDHHGRGLETEYRILSDPFDPRNLAPGQRSHAEASSPVKSRGSETRSKNGSTAERPSQTANDGFHFGELGHRRPSFSRAAALWLGGAAAQCRAIEPL